MKNEKLHASRGCETIDVQVANGDEIEKEKKIPSICYNLAFCLTRVHDDRF